ncbi:MAG: response regulator [Gemmatimonadota bacterium]|nr:response regulator [Gemmatimonadota bacterium]
MSDRSPPTAAPRNGAAGLTPHAEGGESISVLVVEDDETVRTIISRFLGSRGYKPHAVPSGPAALEALARARFPLAVFDVGMPIMSGIELVPHALRADPDLAIIMLTGADDAATATQALSSGAFDYLTKPIDSAIFEEAIGKALHKRRLLVEQRRIERIIREEVESKTAELNALSMNVAETLIKAMEAKSSYLRGHAQRTSDLAASIAEALGLDAAAVDHVRLAGRLHDVGKIGVRESVLDKPGKLTPEEVEHVRDHVRIGMEILSPLVHLGPVLRFVADHHERWDGTGYLQAFRGEEISIGGRILAAVDAYDAITTRRSYQEARSSQEAIAHLANHVGTLLDPHVYEALRKVVEHRNR